MRRIFIETPKDLPNVQYFGSEDIKYLKKVLRLKYSDEIECFDGKGNLYKGTLTTNQSGNKLGVFITEVSKTINTNPKNRLIISSFKIERMETAIEKCTELGIDEIILTRTQYSQVDLSLLERKKNRFTTIIQNASRQAERLFIPEISICETLDLSNLNTSSSKKFIATTETDGQDLSKITSSYQNEDFYLWIGPEGGFSKEELLKYNDLGFVNVKLGKNILRSETACIIGTYLICNR